MEKIAISFLFFAALVVISNAVSLARTNIDVDKERANIGDDIDWFDCERNVPQGYTCSTDEEDDRPCLFPYRYNCSRYIQCDYNAEYGFRAWLRECAPSNPPLVFNNTLKRCDWPLNTECNADPEPTTTGEPTTTTEAETTTEEGEETTAEPTTTEGPEETTTGGPGECVPPEPEERFDCPQPYVAPGLYPTADNCSQFWQCFDYPRDGVRQTCAKENATALLFFNPKFNVCDWQQNVKCKVCQPPSTDEPTEEPTTEAPTTEGPTEEPTPEPTTAGPTEPPSGCPTEEPEPPVDTDDLCKDCPTTPRLVANPNNDQSYVYCSGGNGPNEVRRCSDGLLFSKTGLTCEYAGLVSEFGPKSNLRRRYK